MATDGGAAETGALPHSRGGDSISDLPSPSADSRHEQRVFKVPPRQATDASVVAESVGTSAHECISSSLDAPIRHVR